jgi:hypothetical protein
MPASRVSQSGLPRVPGISTAVTGAAGARVISLSFAFDPARIERLKAAAPVRWRPAFRVWETGEAYRPAIEAFLAGEAVRAGRIAGRPAARDLFAYARAG